MPRLWTGTRSADGHYGQRSCEPRSTGRTHGCTSDAKVLTCQAGAVHTVEFPEPSNHGTLGKLGGHYPQPFNCCLFLNTRLHPRSVHYAVEPVEDLLRSRQGLRDVSAVARVQSLRRMLQGQNKPRKRGRRARSCTWRAKLQLAPKSI